VPYKSQAVILENTNPLSSRKTFFQQIIKEQIIWEKIIRIIWLKAFGVHSPIKDPQSLILAASGVLPQGAIARLRALQINKSVVGQEYPFYQARFPQYIEEEP